MAKQKLYQSINVSWCNLPTTYIYSIYYTYSIYYIYILYIIYILYYIVYTYIGSIVIHNHDCILEM